MAYKFKEGDRVYWFGDCNHLPDSGVFVKSGDPIYCDKSNL